MTPEPVAPVNPVDNRGELVALRETGDRMVELLNKAGLLRLSDAVQLGPTVWYVHMSQAIERWEAWKADRVIPIPGERT